MAAALVEAVEAVVEAVALVEAVETEAAEARHERVVCGNVGSVHAGDAGGEGSMNLHMYVSWAYMVRIHPDIHRICSQSRSNHRSSDNTPLMKDACWCTAGPCRRWSAAAERHLARRPSPFPRPAGLPSPTRNVRARPRAKQPPLRLAQSPSSAHDGRECERRPQTPQSARRGSRLSRASGLQYAAGSGQLY